MKLLSSFTLAGVLILAGHAHGQTPNQSNPPATTPPASSSPGESASPGRDCKKEVKKLCGHTVHKQETQDCIKANLDMKKFSAACQTELANSNKSGS
jgi:hypothetical protein